MHGFNIPWMRLRGVGNSGLVKLKRLSVLTGFEP